VNRRATNPPSRPPLSPQAEAEWAALMKRFDPKNMSPSQRKARALKLKELRRRRLAGELELLLD
jgi:hypothetical protein